MTRQGILMILIMTLLIGLVLSAVSVWQGQGFSAGFIAAWLNRFAGTYIIVLPTVLIVAPIAQRSSIRIDQWIAHHAQKRR